MIKTTMPVMLAALWVAILGGPMTAVAADYHHVHITAPSPAKAVEWYTDHLDCEPVADRGDAVSCQGVELVFVPQSTTGGSPGTGVNHIGFSYADLSAKMAQLEAVGVRGSGVRLQRFADGSTVRDVPGLFKLAFVFDPWGTRIELVEDTERLGFHHVHLSATDPEATLAWYRDVLGGEPASLKGRLDGVRFDGVWFLVSQAEVTPASTAGRAIDHIAFVVPNLAVAATQLAEHGVRFEMEPRVPENARTSAKRAFLVGPDDVRVAMVETGFAGVTTELDVTVLTADALGPYDAPRTPWGDPDIQGIWTSSSAAAIPFERPTDTDTGELTPEDALARHEGRLLGGIWGYEREWRDITLGYDGAAVSTQVAMVIEPADGRVPALTAEGEERVAVLEAERARRASVPAAGPEERSPYDRCITRGLIPLPAGYNNGLQIVEGPGHVAITREMIHETRVIPTELGPAVGSPVSSWQGHSQGRWEGDTLIVETSNFNGRIPFRGSSESLTLVERYTRMDADTLEYRFTVDDPAVWTEPWTGMFRWRRDDSQYELVEYACHEGNYGMSNILSAARARDAAAEGER